jgi:hypothetical protein
MALLKCNNCDTLVGNTKSPMLLQHVGFLVGLRM